MTWCRTAANTGAVTILAMLLTASTTTAASAANGEARPDGPPATARLDGDHIDLRRGWGDAQTCVVWNRTDPVDCFRTEQAADAAVQRRERAEMREATRAAPVATTTAAWPSSPGTTSPAPRALLADAGQCGDWLTLYEDAGRSGRSLRFRDRGYWQDLASYGFANETSSFTTTACSASFASSGWESYPGFTGTYYAAWSMSSGWNDRVRFIRVN